LIPGSQMSDVYSEPNVISTDYFTGLPGSIIVPISKTTGVSVHYRPFDDEDVEYRSVQNGSPGSSTYPPDLPALVIIGDGVGTNPVKFQIERVINFEATPNNNSISLVSTELASNDTLAYDEAFNAMQGEVFASRSGGDIARTESMKQFIAKPAIRELPFAFVEQLPDLPKGVPEELRPLLPKRFLMLKEKPSIDVLAKICNGNGIPFDDFRGLFKTNEDLARLALCLFCNDGYRRKFKYDEGPNAFLEFAKLISNPHKELVHDWTLTWPKTGLMPHGLRITPAPMKVTRANKFQTKIAQKRRKISSKIDDEPSEGEKDPSLFEQVVSGLISSAPQIGMKLASFL